MSKKQLQPNKQGQQLLAIEQLSQQLETYFKESEHLKRENFLFESYFLRLDKTYKTTQSKQTTTKKNNRLSQQNITAATLSPEQKYQIAQQEAEALKDTIEKGRIKSDAILQTLRAILEETDMAIAEIRKDAYDFQRQILMGGENSRTGNIEADRIQKFFMQKQRQKKALIQKYKNKKQTLATQIVKTNNQISKKQEMGDQLKFIDFHQLQIENKKYVKQIEQKNQKLLDSKISSGKIGADLLQVKKRLNQIVNKIAKDQKQIIEKQKLIEELKKNMIEHTKKETDLGEKKKKLQTQAEQMKSPNNSTTQIPNTMTYVLQKRKQEQLLYEKKNLERKLLIAMPMFQKAKKALGI